MGKCVELEALGALPVMGWTALCNRQPCSWLWSNPLSENSDRGLLCSVSEEWFQGTELRQGDQLASLYRGLGIPQAWRTAAPLPNFQKLLLLRQARV